MCRVVATLVLMFVIAPSVYAVTDYDAVLKDAKAKVQAGDLQGAVDLCLDVIEDKPGAPFEPKARVLMGYIHLKKGTPPNQIIEHFLQVANQFPDAAEAPDALLRVGYLRDKTGAQPDEWRQVVDKYPNTREAAEALHCLGHKALRNGDSELAAKKFEESAAVKEATPQRAEDSLIEAGYAYISQFWKTTDHKYLAKAVNHLLRVKTKAVKSEAAIKSRMALGEIYLIQGLGDQAAGEFRSVLSMNPKDAYTRAVAEFELASALYCKGDWTAALEGFEAFLSTRSGQTLVEKDEQWRALRPGYAKLIAADPQKASALSGLELIPTATCWKAAALAKLGRYQEAKQLTDEILATFPQLSIGWRVRSVRQECTDKLGEGN